MRISLDIDALRAIVIAADRGSFASAASQLGRSQSAISMQLKKLDEQVGRALFRRVGRGLAPTDAGDSLLDYARRIVALNDEAISSLRNSPTFGSVRLGLPQDMFEDIVPDVLRHFARKRPDIHIEVRAGRNFGLKDEIRAGRLDIALAFFESGAESAGARLTTMPVNWYASRDFAQPNANDVIPLVLFDHPCLFRQIALRVLERNRIGWRLALTTPSLPGVWAALQSCSGITPRTPRRVPKNIRQIGRALRLPPLPDIELRFLEADRLSPAAQDLRNVVFDVARKRLT